ncbi:LamG domain-containing protein [Haloarcula sp. NS06]|uniref:LamG domain-containing protein n=1 Tax=Haloarcula sp. NS06 TaxID=3409688 RepID=UPI003DA779A2
MSKKWTRRSALALIGSGAGLLTWGTGGFTDVTADRQVNIDTTEDSSDGPLFGIKSLADSGGPGQRVSLITFQNNLDEEVGVNLNAATVDSDDTTEVADLFKGEGTDPANYFDTPDSVGPGKQGTIEATLDLLPDVSIGSDREYDLPLDFTAGAKNENQTITLSRTPTVTYEDPRVSYWDFEQIGGQTVSDIWSGNDASRKSVGWSRGTYYGYEPDPADGGNRGTVLEFGGDRYSGGRGVITVSNSELDFTDDFSLSIWIKPTSIPNLYARLFSKWDSPRNNRDSDAEKGYQFFLGETDDRSDNKFEIGIETGQRSGKTNEIKTGATVGEGNWNHVVWTHRSSNPSEDRVYVNGDYENDGYSGDLKDPFGSDEPLRIGNGIDGNDDLSFPFDGFMDEPKAYDTALTSEQVQNLYATSKNGDSGSIGG